MKQTIEYLRLRIDELKASREALTMQIHQHNAAIGEAEAVLVKLLDEMEDDMIRKVPEVFEFVNGEDE